MLGRIHGLREELPPAERKVADAVLSRPEAWMGTPARTLALQAGVSEPTVLRFCRSVGCASFGEFKVRLAQSLVTTGPGGGHPPTRVRAGDSVADAAGKVFRSTIEVITQVREQLDIGAVERSAVALLKARRIDIYGLGASGLVAADAQHKLFRLTNHANAYADSHMQLMAAATLGPEDVVLAISHSGRTDELLQTVDVALAAGATVIAITMPGSDLAGRASIVIPVDVRESTEFYTPMVSRLAHLVVVDALFVGLALLSPPAHAGRQRRMEAALASRRVDPQEAAGAAVAVVGARPEKGVMGL